MGKVPPAGKQSDCRFRRSGSDLAPERCPHSSRAVRALSGVTVLCPFLHEQTSPTRRVGLLRARWRRCLGAIAISDAVCSLGSGRPHEPRAYELTPPPTGHKIRWMASGAAWLGFPIGHADRAHRPNRTMTHTATPVATPPERSALTRGFVSAVLPRPPANAASSGSAARDRGASVRPDPRPLSNL